MDCHRILALTTLVLTFCVAPAQAQGTASEMLEKVYGTTPDRPDGYTFTKVIHYSIVQQVEGAAGQPKRTIEGTMDLYYSPGQASYGRVVETADARLSHVGDLDLGMRYTLTALGETKVGNEAPLSASMRDTLVMSRVSGDREIDGRMSAHYWYEKGTTIEELWADSQASEEETAIGRLWPRFEPGFASLATGTYEGLATRWVSIDTKFSRDPRIVLVFEGAEELEEPMDISFLGYIFPVSEAELMRRRLEAERQ